MQHAFCVFISYISNLIFIVQSSGTVKWFMQATVYWSGNRTLIQIYDGLKDIKKGLLDRMGEMGLI